MEKLEQKLSLKNREETGEGKNWGDVLEKNESIFLQTKNNTLFCA